MSRAPRHLLSVFLLLTGCGAGLTGSGRRVTEERTVPAFRVLEVHSAIEVTATRGARTLSIEADDNVLPFVETTVIGDRLVIRLAPATALWGTSRPVEVQVANDVFEGVDASGASVVRLPATRVGTLPLSASGASSLEVTGVDADDVDVTLDGASKVKATGRATAMHLSLHGASYASVTELPVDRLTLALHGASKASARVTVAVQGEASGASSVELQGNPGRVDVSLSGASTVQRLAP